MTDPSAGPPAPDFNGNEFEAGGFGESKAARKAARTQDQRQHRAETREHKRAVRHARRSNPTVMRSIVKSMVYMVTGAVVAIGVVGGGILTYVGLKSPNSERDARNAGALKPSGRAALLKQDPEVMMRSPADFGPALYDMAPVPQDSPRLPEWLFGQTMQYFMAGYGTNVSDVKDQPDRAARLIDRWLRADPEKKAALEERYGGKVYEPREQRNPTVDIQSDVDAVRFLVASGLAKATVATGLADMAKDGTDALCTGDERKDGLKDLTSIEEEWAKAALDDFNAARRQLGLPEFEYRKFNVETCQKLLKEGAGTSLGEIEREQRDAATTTELPPSSAPSTTVAPSTTTTRPQAEGSSYRVPGPGPEGATESSAPAVGVPAGFTPQQAKLYAIMANATRSGPRHAVAHVRADGTVHVQGIA